MSEVSKREVVKMVLDGKKPPYVPWSFRFTHEAVRKLESHWGRNWESKLDNHFTELGSDIGIFENLGDNRFKDMFGVVWDRTIEKDIGLPEEDILKEPSLDNYSFPNPLDKRVFREIDKNIAKDPDCLRVFCIGFSLYERAWSLRGITNLLMDLYENPEFVHELFGRIVDYNISQLTHAIENYEIDAVYFGDDWGQQQGLIMGPGLWKEFILPHLTRMYEAVRNKKKYILAHSCGDVDEIFPDLVNIGLSCFNPFQPEVMDTDKLLEEYRGTLAFWGGLSTQRTLPFGTEEEVRKETKHLLDVGSEGGYILSPAHAVEGDVSLENILAFIEEAHDARRQAKVTITPGILQRDVIQ